MKSNLAFRTAIIYLASLALLVGTAGAGKADIVIRNAVNAGWYSDVGYHNPSNSNYIAGFEISQPGFDYHNFFVFDLSGIVPGTIISAELRLYNPRTGFRSPDPTETYTLFDVSTAIPLLIAGGDGLTSVYDDLGSGVTYGSRVVSPADNDTLVTISLNSSALADLNNPGGLIAIGGSLTTLRPVRSSAEYVFGATNTPSDTKQLVLVTSAAAVPEPSTLGLVGLGLLGYARRPKKRISKRG